MVSVGPNISEIFNISENDPPNILLRVDDDLMLFCVKHVNVLFWSMPALA